MYDTNEIYHHGVKGQSWGKRNGPPYPLDAQGKASLRKQRMESYGKSITKGTESESRDQKQLNAKSKEDYKMYKEYNKQRAHKAVKRDAAIAMLGGGAVGTIAGGPIGGVASMLASGLATTAFSSAVNAGRNAVSNSKYKQMLLDSQEVKSATEKGKAIVQESKDNTNSTDKTQHMQTRNSFSTDERKDLWESAMSRAENPKLTSKQQKEAKAFADRVKAADANNKNYKSPNNGKYDTTFLEAIQNKEILAIDDTKSIDAEYAKYKQNPEKYFTEEANKLRDY